MAKFANIIAGAGNPPPVPLLPPASLTGPDGAGSLSLFLDFDGTLVDLAARPDAVSVSPRLPHLLTRLAHRLQGRLALISGRGADDVIGLIGPLPIAVAGSHGAEVRFADGRTLAPQRPATLAIVLGAFHDLARATPGVLVEDKPHGVALHYRAVPEAADKYHTIAADLAARLGLQLQTGKMMVEVRAPGADKGVALTRMMQEPGLLGTTPLFFGDDDTDEPAFAAAHRLGGAGVIVGTPAPRRTTSARFALSGVSAVHAWLQGVADL
ncbi:MAG: hypothetical protein RIS85_2275 [Pseudomonadota bacterium]|jgi:trehalose 6-phosphate phosphatase